MQIYSSTQKIHFTASGFGNPGKNSHIKNSKTNIPAFTGVNIVSGINSCLSALFEEKPDLFEKINEKIYKGSKPKTRGHIVYLDKAGIKTILSLEFMEEKALLEAKKRNIRVINIPECGVRPGALSKALDYMKSKDTGICYVHCHAGIEKTGYLIAAYQLLEENRDWVSVYDEFCKINFINKNNLTLNDFKEEMKKIMNTAYSHLRMETVICRA